LRNVLVVSFHFPPYDSTAAVEASQLVRHLPERGWAPIVLSARSVYDQTLPAERVRVHRTRSVDFNRPLVRSGAVDRSAASAPRSTERALARALGGAWWQLTNLPDRHVGWLPFALRRGHGLLQEEEIDLIFSVAGPFTSHLVASRLAARSGLPWFADFRDLWTDNHYYRRVEPLRSLEIALEERTLAGASALSAATPRWAARLRERFGKPTWVIGNGFDPEAIIDAPPPTDRFVLTYTGTLYPGGQDPAPLLRAVARLRDAGVVDPTRFELRFVGRHSRSVVPDVRRLGIDDLVTHSGVVPHADALHLQATSHALAMLLWATPAGRGWLSAKLYEYAAAGRPVLAVGPTDSDAAREVLALSAGVAVADDVEAAQMLARWIEEWSRTGAVEHQRDDAALRVHEWRHLSHRLADAFSATV